MKPVTMYDDKDVITHANESHGSKVFIRICLSDGFLHDRTKMAETTVTKLATESPS